MLATFFKKIDWWIVLTVFPLLSLSLTTLNGFSLSGSSLMLRQLVMIVVSLIFFFFLAFVNFSFIKQSRIIFYIYIFSVALLVALVFVGSTTKGATSWFDFGAFSFQPSDLIKLTLVLLLAKYLARRHIEIRSMKHIFITGLYFIIPFGLIVLQPDFGSALIVFCIWFGMILVSGISKKHLGLLFATGFLVFVLMWSFGFKDYQKDRIRTFLDPLSDIQGAGYNAYQSVIAVGSGELTGKGVGYGTQSRLSFLPEHETDFIFAAISEEWGFVGSSLMILLFLILIVRILLIGYHTHSIFELLFAVGLAMYYMSHVIVNIGMNIGVMPVTGVPLPFVSYGGTHILIEFIGLGMLMSFRNNARSLYKDNSPDVFLR